MLTPIVLSTGLNASAALDGTTADEKLWRFAVYVNDKPVGTHEFRMQQQGEQMLLSSVAEFEYTLMLIPVYRYQHRNHEIWQDGCLTRIESSTNANGKDYAVLGQAAPDGFVIEGSKGEAVLPGCVQTFAYWSPEFLQASQLLNSQNGEYMDVTVSEPVSESIEVLGQPILAQRFELTARKLKLELWYSQTGEWLGLQSIYDNGRKLRYELISQPVSLAGSGNNDKLSSL